MTMTMGNGRGGQRKDPTSSALPNGGVLKKGPWSAAEDAVLMDYVKKHGEGNWNAVQRNTGLQRCGKSCRLRWANHLRPNLKKGSFNVDEERLIIDLHSKLGNKWARISSHLPGRTDNEIKNYWNTRIKRKIRQGLPLYPNDVQTTPPPPPPLHPPTLPLSLPKTQPPTLSLFNTVSLSSPLFTPYNHHPPQFFPSHNLKRCSTNSYIGNPTFTPTQMGPIQVSPMGFGFEPSRRMESEGIGLGNFELPSMQLGQNNSVTTGSYTDFGDQMKFWTNNGLLDDLLQEAQHKVGFKNEREDDGGFQWDVSSSENSSNGHKKDELGEQRMNFGSQDLSNILDLIPSLVQVPSWCNNSGGAESSAAQSAAASTDDNYNRHNDDRMPQPPSLAAVSTTNIGDDNEDGNWNSGCYTWDNLPNIC